MPTLTHANGQTTYYEDDNYTDPWKPHETILIQHGYGRHSAFWYHWIPALARHYRVIRRDARGHGKSSAPDKASGYDYSVDTILGEIVNTLDQLGISKVHWLGESTGGIWGEAMAVHHPERLLSLTVCSSPMYLPPAALKSLSFGYDSWAESLRKLGSRGWAVEAAKLLKTDQVHDQMYTKWWVDQVAVPSGDALADHAELLEKIDAREFVDQIKVPMLILAPRNSTLATLDGDDNQHDLNRRVKGSQMIVIDGKGHEIYIDEPEACQKAFLSFLSELKK